jgi:hypothetical protein
MAMKASKTPHDPCGKFSFPDPKRRNLLSLRQPTQVSKPRHELLERDSFEAKKIASDISVTLAEWQWLYCSNAIRIRSGNNVPQAKAIELRSAFFPKLSIVLFTPFPLVESQSADWCYLNLSTQKYVTGQTRPSR